MCGRFTQKQLARRYLEELEPGWQGEIREERAPTWNLAPSAASWAIRDVDQHATPALLKWGFRPDPTEKGLAPINARVETAAQKYLFRDAWKQRRCVVPADGWYEWKALPTGKQPYYFTRTDDRPLFFAGLWTGPTFCLFTTAADGALNEVHDRKPLSLEPAHALAWIREGCATDELISRAIPAGAIRFHPVSKAVSNWRNDGAHLIEINSL